MIALCLALVSIIINLIIIVKIARNPSLRKSGYFQLHIFFLVTNTMYLILTCPHRAIMAQSVVYNYWGWTLPGYTFIANHLWMLKPLTDLPHCLLGLQVRFFNLFRNRN